MIPIRSNPNEPFFSKEHLDLHWRMTRCEKYALLGLLGHIRPKYSLEIGTYKGGSLQMISKYSKSVHCLDISDDYVNALKGKFDNVSFHIGDSKDVLPKMVSEINLSNKSLNFVLVDGDHSEKGVQNDINSLLELIPKEPMYIVMHDSFNPQCRKGILGANWEGCGFVQYVELDYIPGVYHEKAHDSAEPRSMWGGFALAYLSPEVRNGDLLLNQSQKGLFESTYKSSSYSDKGKLISRLFSS